MSILPKIKDYFRKSHIKWLLFKSNTNPEIQINGSTLIVSPHPDDEVIGCGGLISRLVEEGNSPYIVFMTGGGASHKTCCNLSEEEIIKNRRILTRESLGILGVKEDHIYELNFPDGKIPYPNDEGQVTNDDPNIFKLKSLLSTFQSPLSNLNIFVPHWGEGWPDHINTAKIIKAITPQNAQIWEYCVWMWYYNIWRGLDWENAFRLKLDKDEREKKLKAIAVYTDTLASCGKPWSGVLPEIFKSAHKKGFELYFKSFL